MVCEEHIKNLNNKFLLEDEFNIDSIKDKSILELGRACVAEKYRSGGVIMLLWKGAFHYALTNNIQYMLGTASFHGTDVNPYRKQLAYLTKNYLSEVDAYAVNNTFDLINDNIEYDNEEEFNNLPPLIKGYLRIGSKIGKNAYIDTDFCSVDVLIVTDIENLNPRYKQRFSK